MTDQLPPHAEFLRFAETLADASRAILRKAARTDPAVELKPDTSYVTDTDRAVERTLRAMIIDAYPDHGILGEEFDNINTGAEFVWVLDPIDGTAAWVAGIPVYGTLIALAWNGAPFIGIIDHPATNDRWTGVSGKLATFNGAPARVRACSDLARAYATCSNPDFMSPSELAQFHKVRDRVTYVQYGGSCYAYGLLASGRTDLAIDSGLEAFDLYASAAVILGAGGHMCDWQGGPISLGMKGTVIACGDPRRRDEVLEMLSPI